MDPCGCDSGSILSKHVNMRLLDQTHAAFLLMPVQHAAQHQVCQLEVSSSSLVLSWQGVTVSGDTRCEVGVCVFVCVFASWKGFDGFQGEVSPWLDLLLSACKEARTPHTSGGIALPL